MVKFAARDPFPYLPLLAFSKSEAQTHAAEADRWLTLRVDETERVLATGGSRDPARETSRQHQQLWFGLEPRDLQTPYLEIRALLESVLPVSRPQVVVDLGAAYARMAFVIERHFPLARFQGFEYVGERVREARRALSRFGAQRSDVLHVDLTWPQFQIPQADLYFLYDYGTPAAIEKTLHDLKRIALERPITIVARGRVCRYSIESRHAFWLQPADPGAPERTFTVYRSRIDISRVDISRVEAPVQNAVEIIDSAHHA